MAKFERAEIEEAFRNYYFTGIVGEDWVAWSQLFTDDATYKDHYWGTFHGPKEIEMFLEGTMSLASSSRPTVVRLGILRNSAESSRSTRGVCGIIPGMLRVPGSTPFCREQLTVRAGRSRRLPRGILVGTSTMPSTR